jgi:5-methylcytosine-specific restriction endonuclease McrA
MARIRSIKPAFKKAAIPAAVRRAVAARYGCSPGETVNVTCAYCDFKSDIHWFVGVTGRSNSLGWPSFGHFEMDHIVSEYRGGTTTAENIVLACRGCNRSKGPKHAADWRAK